MQKLEYNKEGTTVQRVKSGSKMKSQNVAQYEREKSKIPNLSYILIGIDDVNNKVNQRNVRIIALSYNGEKLLQFHSQEITQNTYPQKHLYVSIFSSLIHYSQKSEATQML